MSFGTLVSQHPCVELSGFERRLEHAPTPVPKKYQGPFTPCPTKDGRPVKSALKTPRTQQAQPTPRSVRFSTYNSLAQPSQWATQAEAVPWDFHEDRHGAYGSGKAGKKKEHEVAVDWGKKCRTLGVAQALSELKSSPSATPSCASRRS